MEFFVTKKMEEARFHFSKNMALFCKSQMMLWRSIHERERESLSLDYGHQETPVFEREDQPAVNPAVFPAPPQQRRQPNRPGLRIRDQDLRARIIHVLGVISVALILKLRGYVLWFACIYSVLVLCGLPMPGGAPQRVQPGRLTLDGALARLRMLYIAEQRLRDLQDKIRGGVEMTEVEEQQLAKDLEFLKGLEPKHSWYYRAFYQLVVMFLLTLLPSCNPDPELIK